MLIFNLIKESANTTSKLSRLLMIATLVGVALFSFNVFIFQDRSILLYDYKRLFACLVIVVTSIIVIFNNKVNESITIRLLSLNSKVLLAIFLLLFFALISNLFGLYLIRGLIDYYYFIGLFIFTIICSFVAIERKRFFFDLIAIISIFCFLSVFIASTVFLYIGEEFSIHNILSYTNPRMLNQVQVWLIIPSLYIAIIHKSKKTYVPLVLNFATMFATDARGLSIATIVAIILWAIIDSKNRKKILLISVITIVLGFIVKVVIISPLPNILFFGGSVEFLIPEIRTTTADRISLWKHALEMATFWGHGGDAFACNSTMAPKRPHNSMLLVLVNWGVIPLLAYIYLIYSLFMSALFEKSKKTLYLKITILSGVAYSFVSGVLGSPFSQLLCCIFIGLYWSHFPLKEFKPHKIYNIVLRVICLIVIVAISFKVYDRVKHDFYQDEKFAEQVYAPQFWLGNNCHGVEPKLQL